MCCARVDAGNAHIRSTTMPASHNTKLCKRKRRQKETETLISKFGSNSLSFSRSLSPLLTTAFIARTRSNSRETRANEFKLERMILPEKSTKCHYTTHARRKRESQRNSLANDLAYSIYEQENHPVSSSCALISTILHQK